jgi:hypothetical protein
MSAPPGFTLHDPDVVLTDLALAGLGAFFAWRLLRAPGLLARRGVLIMGALASAAFWGAVFHAFFPAGTATPLGFAAWMPVALSIAAIGTALLALALRVATPRISPAVRRIPCIVYAAAFALTVLLIDSSYRTIVLFYGPVVVLFLIVSVREALRSRSTGWTLIAVSFGVSLLAAAVQQARVALHPEYFDHNAVYHVLQGIALVLLYRGFLRAPDPPGSAAVSRTSAVRTAS